MSLDRKFNLSPEEFPWESYDIRGLRSFLHPTNQTLLINLKRQNRLRKGRIFNAFVLHQGIDRQTERDQELDNFLKVLKQNRHLIPSGTRIQLAVLTTQAPDRSRNYKHFTAVDILIENSQVSSFVLDAANSSGYFEIYCKLEEAFPGGRHYRYRAHEAKKAIQTQHHECGVFTFEHIKQLSQISTTDLYHKELPALTTATPNMIRAENLRGGEKLVRVFRSMQSLSLLRNLREPVRATPVKEESKETLEDSFNRTTIDRKNAAIIYKKKSYIKKLRTYILTTEQANRIKALRTGTTYLENPILFKLHHYLVNNFNEESGKTEFNNFINQFCKELDKKAPKKCDGIAWFTAFHSTKVKKVIADLRQLAELDKLEIAKNEFILIIAEFCKYLDKENSFRTKAALNEILNNRVDPKPKQEIIEEELPVDRALFRGI